MPGNNFVTYTEGIMSKEEAAVGRPVQVSSGRDWGVINPRGHPLMPYWDVVMIVALVFTATVTPYEVAFFDEPNILKGEMDAMWVANRVVDLLFSTRKPLCRTRDIPPKALPVPLLSVPIPSRLAQTARQSLTSC